MNSVFQYPIMCRIYFIATWTGLGYVVGWFLCIFYAYVVVCIIRVYCIQYTLFLAIIRLIHPSSNLIVLINHPLHYLYSRMIQQNILCISCVHFVHQPLSDPLNIPIRPNHTRYVVESIDIYPYLIFVCNLCCYASIVLCRVVNPSS